MEIKPYHKNAKKHPKKQIKALADIVELVGWRQPVLVNQDKVIVAGHGRWITWIENKDRLKEIWVIDDKGNTVMGEPETTPLTKEQEKIYRLADNKLNESDWEMELVIEELKELSPAEIDLTGFDRELVLTESEEKELRRSLAGDFIVPPFSVWDARQGYWQDRKREWIKLIGDSGEGRSDTLLGEGLKKLAEGTSLTGTSIFDPVVAELSYKWFSPKKANILDPFAGGNTRGVVASICGREYTGIDLSKKQVEVNRKKVKELGLDTKYIVGNSLDIEKLLKPDEKFDFIFSCPPYYDLEKYDSGEGDLSTLSTFEEFIRDYKKIIKLSVDRLKGDRFAVFVVGEIRGKDGVYRNFVADTIKAFKEAGMDYYNEIVLLTSAGTAPMRARIPFRKNRKVAKTHQNVLCFYKGDQSKIHKNMGEVNTEIIIKNGKDETELWKY